MSASDVPRYRELMLHAYAAAPDAFIATPEERAAEPESWWLRRAVDPSGLSVAEPMAIATPEGYKAKVHMWLPIGGATAA